MILDILEWMEEWLAKNCDGDWEHAQNFTITTIDNPGWSVTINLKGTKLEERIFSTVEIENSDSDWLYCTVKNQQFQGDGGIRNLIEILKIFIKWAETN
ncbi:MAG: immunity 53 family protein [Parachlamydiaceae bacterium]